MRRPINWFVFCLSLGFLFANLSFGRKPLTTTGEATPVPEQFEFSYATVGEPGPTQFGYVRADGSFLPLAQQATQRDVDAVITEADRSAASGASKLPARF